MTLAQILRVDPSNLRSEYYPASSRGLGIRGKDWGSCKRAREFNVDPVNANIRASEMD